MARNTQAEDINMLWKAITVLEAQDMLIALKVAEYPKMKQNVKAKLHKQIHRQAFPERQRTKPMSMDELKEFLANGG